MPNSLKDKRLSSTLPFSRRPVRLKTVFDLNRLLARIINQLLRGEIEGSIAGRVGYLCGIMLKSFEGIEFENRLKELEELVRKGNQNA